MSSRTVIQGRDRDLLHIELLSLHDFTFRSASPTLFNLYLTDGSPVPSSKVNDVNVALSRIVARLFATERWSNHKRRTFIPYTIRWKQPFIVFRDLIE